MTKILESTESFSFYFFFPLLLLAVVVLVGCNRTEGDNVVPSFGAPSPSQVDRGILPPVDDENARIWNTQPHGGKYEKSNRSPCGPVD